MKLRYQIVFIIFIFFMLSCSDTMNQEKQNVLTDEEVKDGWTLLFDGKSLDKWRNFKHPEIISGWVAEDDALVALGKGSDSMGDIITKDQFENFDLKVEWKLSREGNSGIFYGILEDGFERVYDTGPEYQVIDDVNFPDPLEEWQKCGADYAMYLPNDKKVLKPVGEWNSSEIIVNDSLVQYWLNEEKIIEFKRWTPEWHEKAQTGKWKDFPSYGLSPKGHIGLQDHGNKIWFRNIKIKEL